METQVIQMLETISELLRVGMFQGGNGAHLAQSIAFVDQMVLDAKAKLAEPTSPEAPNA